MTGKPAARDCTHPTYPEYRERFGEDPARFLYHMPTVKERLRGINNTDLLRAYHHVEAAKDDPDPSILTWITNRIQELEAPNGPSVSGEAVATDGGERR